MQVYHQDARIALAALADAGARFDVVYLDPPYDERPLRAAARGAAADGLLETDGLVVAEHFHKRALPETIGRLVSDALGARGRPPAHASIGEARRRRLKQRSARIAWPSSRARSTRSPTATSTSSRAASRVFDEVIIAILVNPEKQPLFTVEERVEIIRETYAGEPRDARSTPSPGLLVDYAEQVGATVIVRGLRAISDFEYEFQMALMNRRLNPRIETVFMMPAEGYSYLSSRLVKEVFQLGGGVRELVPPVVERRLREKYGAAAAAGRACAGGGAS